MALHILFDVYGRAVRGELPSPLRPLWQATSGLLVSTIRSSRIFSAVLFLPVEPTYDGTSKQYSVSNVLYGTLLPQVVKTGSARDGYSLPGMVTENGYLRHLRRTSGLTLQQLQHEVGIPFTVLGRLEQGLIGQIKLATAIALDRQWRQEGRVLALFWSVARQAPVTEARTE
jgi:hypothetical protein